MADAVPEQEKPPETLLASLDANAQLAVGRLANILEVELIPRASIDNLVRLQTTLRDAWHGVRRQLNALADSAALTAPDLRILTIEPLVDVLSKSSGYGWRKDPIRHSKKFHHGTDMRADHGTPVLVAGDGVVVFAAVQGGYGNVIYVDHGGGIVTRYAHLQKIDAKKDAPVTAGQRIGRVGSSGRSTGPHLHFEVRIDGRDVDPVTALHVGELQRTLPDAGRIAAYALAPELQAAAVSTEDKKVAKQPVAKQAAKPVRTKRAQVLW